MKILLLSVPLIFNFYIISATGDLLGALPLLSSQQKDATATSSKKPAKNNARSINQSNEPQRNQGHSIVDNVFKNTPVSSSYSQSENSYQSYSHQTQSENGKPELSSSQSRREGNRTYHLRTNSQTEESSSSYISEQEENPSSLPLFAPSFFDNSNPKPASSSMNFPKNKNTGDISQPKKSDLSNQHEFPTPPPLPEQPYMMSPFSTQSDDMPPMPNQSPMAPMPNQSPMAPMPKQSPMPPMPKQLDMPPMPKQLDMPPMPKQHDMAPLPNYHTMQPTPTMDNKKAKKIVVTTTTEKPKKFHTEEIRASLSVCSSKKNIKCSTRTNDNEEKYFRAATSIKNKKMQCIVEGRTPEIDFVRFILEARSVWNGEGSRALGGGSNVSKQRGKCSVTYLCDGSSLLNVRSTCISGTYTADDKLIKLTRRMKRWFPPPGYKDDVHFSVKIDNTDNTFLLDVESMVIGDVNALNRTETYVVRTTPAPVEW